ncbi:hypothetical protein AB4457_24110 [Vibrio splendidus]
MNTMHLGGKRSDGVPLSFLAKLQGLITSSQTKAFALSGVMVAIEALARTNNFLRVVAIVTGIVMTKILITKSNQLIRENLEHFKDTFDRELGHYVNSRTKAEVVKSCQSHFKMSLFVLNRNVPLLSLSNGGFNGSVSTVLMARDACCQRFGFVAGLNSSFRCAYWMAISPFG